MLKEGASNPFSCLTSSSTCTARVKPGLKFHRKVSACHVRLKNRVCCICKRCFWKQSTLRPPRTMTLFKRFQHAKLRECPERLSNMRRPVVSTSAPSSALPSSNMVQGCQPCRRHVLDSWKGSPCCNFLALSSKLKDPTPEHQKCAACPAASLAALVEGPSWLR